MSKALRPKYINEYSESVIEVLSSYLHGNCPIAEGSLSCSYYNLKHCMRNACFDTYLILNAKRPCDPSMEGCHHEKLFLLLAAIRATLKTLISLNRFFRWLRGESFQRVNFKHDKTTTSVLNTRSIDDQKKGHYLAYDLRMNLCTVPSLLGRVSRLKKMNYLVLPAKPKRRSKPCHYNAQKQCICDACEIHEKMDGQWVVFNCPLNPGDEHGIRRAPVSDSGH